MKGRMGGNGSGINGDDVVGWDGGNSSTVEVDKVVADMAQGYVGPHGRGKTRVFSNLTLVID